jgi:hypothetical protein
MLHFCSRKEVCTGLEAYAVYEGSMDSDDFMSYLEDTLVRLSFLIIKLPEMNTFPNGRSVLFKLDNASIHHSEEAHEICTNFGVVLEFLPAYSGIGIG